MKQYDSYKDSGVEWIGEIPSGWEVKRFSYSFGIQKGKIPKVLTSDKRENSLPYLSMDVLRGGEPSQFTDGEDYVVVDKGDLGLLWDGSNSGEVISINQKGVLSSTVSVLLPKDKNLQSGYSYYLLKFYESDFKSNTVGMGIPHVDGDHVKETKLLIPPLTEQHQIVEYLDRKTSSIDSLIQSKEKKITLLKEKRTSLINQVITKGLNPDVEMKDSGVEWIGEIPRGWKVIPIKYSLTETKDSIRTGPFGSSLKSDEFIDEGIRVYNQRSVYDEDFSKSDVFISQSKFEELKSFVVKPNDVLITSRGTIGKMTIVPTNGELGVLHPCLIRLRTDDKKLNKRFLWWYVNHSSLFLESVRLESNSTTIDVIYSDTLSNISFPLPPLNEQHHIVEYLDRETKLIDETISSEGKKIELLKEYKQSLISEVVTGKRKVVN